ncbi:hypothetical protein GCM10017691_36240 [Pseudonocardia petroleophila]|uniref:Uncharacterized protein n=1 Tax=Pseudonocardia petroleophila TaxID=37331 RepID=A0A7G7MCV2_9PSEU|nr:hypothetical protein [Pseudonocardia petroleophila]QNG50613.1 hypothetical protein H6H00_20595 [Pseudonocardia petroleophila]
MSLWSRITGSGRTDPDGRGSGEDVAEDPALASNRDTGGEHTDLTGDRGSVTGTGRTEEFVGRIAGDDLGYAGETGAERRAEAAADDDGHPAPPR